MLPLLVAVAGSLVVHAFALFGTEVELFGETPEPVTLQAELRPFPPAAAIPALSRSTSEKRKKAAPPKAVHGSEPLVAAPSTNEAETAMPAPADEVSAPSAPSLPPPAQPILPSSGVIRYALIKESLGLQIGRAEQRWEFPGDGTYRLQGSSETTGLASLFKPVRFENESRGHLVAGGLQPEHYLTRKNGVATKENAVFDWSTVSVLLERDGSSQSVASGTQDLLSFNYQLAYLGRLADGVQMGVVTGRKYEQHALDALGEEEIDTPAGHFRTLHLRAISASVTEVWIALDHHRLPVKIRFTDKKGDSFVQIASEIGAGPAPTPETRTAPHDASP